MPISRPTFPSTYIGAALNRVKQCSYRCDIWYCKTVSQ